MLIGGLRKGMTGCKVVCLVYAAQVMWSSLYFSDGLNIAHHSKKNNLIADSKKKINYNDINLALATYE
jgi:hypothetical protein